VEPKLAELVSYLARSIVESPDEVEVFERVGDRSTTFELRVAQGDMGMVIGKQGRTARALRTLLGAAATKAGRRASLDILE
jgi:predicted RNA-binding protein YlqC (UPF0109 family)